MFFIKIHRSKTKRDINSRFAAFERGEHFPYSTYQFESLSSFVWPPYLSQFAVYKTLLENTFELKYAKNSPASVFYTSLESQKWNKKKKGRRTCCGGPRLLTSKREKFGLFYGGGGLGRGHLVGVVW